VSIPGAVSTSDSPLVGTVHHRGGLTYSLDLQAPADLAVQPHVEILHATDDPVAAWELHEL
jgi:hypothetical protein